MFKDRTLYKVLFCILIWYTGIFQTTTTLEQLNTEPYSAILFTGKRPAAAVRYPNLHGKYSVPPADMNSSQRKVEVSVMGSGLCVGSVNRVKNSNVTKIELKNKDGSSAGTLTIHHAKAKKKTKRLNYSFKKLSNQIMRSKSSMNAKQLTTKTKFQIVDLRLKLASGDYNYTEIHNALKHAERIARVAKKKMKHLQEEEFYEKTNGKQTAQEQMEQLEEQSEEFNQIDTAGMSQEEMERLMQQIQEEMRKIEEELEEAMSSQDLMDDFLQGFSQEMTPKDLEALKKRHRAEEMRDIMEADLEYLKAYFDKLSKEKEEGSSGSTDSNSDSFGNITGVSLELNGMEIPVEAADVPVQVEGANVDVMA